MTGQKLNIVLVEDDRVEAYRLNVAGYILKPVTFQSFCDAMATLDRYWSLVELP